MMPSRHADVFFAIILMPLPPPLVTPFTDDAAIDTFRLMLLQRQLLFFMTLIAFDAAAIDAAADVVVVCGGGACRWQGG